MKITDWLHKDPDEYENWEMKDGELRWDMPVHELLHYRLYEVKVNAELSDAGEYTVLSFELDGKKFIPEV